MSSLIAYRGAASAPDGADFTIAGGQLTTPNREVALIVSTSDYIIGSNNVTEAKVWGSVQDQASPFIAAAEGEADWFRFMPVVPIVLSAGVGVKTINVRVRNAGMLETATMTKTIELVEGRPHASVLWGNDGRSIRSASLGATFSVGWSCSHDFDEYEVWSVYNSVTAQRGDGELLASGAAGSAGEVISTALADEDMPSFNGTGVHMARIFVSVDGQWY